MNGHVNFASSSEDEFPDLDVIFQRSKQTKRPVRSVPQETSANKNNSLPRRDDEKPTSSRLPKQKVSDEMKHGDFAAPPIVRRRKLGQKSDNPLLRPFGGFPNNEGQNLLEVPMRSKKIPAVNVRSLRNQDRATPPMSTPSGEADDDSDDSTHEATEITEADISEYFDARSEFEEEEDDDHAPTFFGQEPRAPTNRQRSARSQQSIPKPTGHSTSRRTPDLDMAHLTSSNNGHSERGTSSKGLGSDRAPGQHSARPTSAIIDLTDDMADALRRLDLTTEEPEKWQKKRQGNDTQVTPPTTPPKPNKTLVSPRKLPGIPKTPHRPSMDLFWSQEFVDDWNEEHSPKKLVLPATQKSPAKNKSTKADTAKQKETKKSFGKRKHDLAQSFLRELDDTITQGQLQSLAESTGGVQIKWSAKLNTTAGRANWRRETVRKLSTSTENSVTHRHHASIELAEKVIDDENRLLNVVAHEFCHLANFMVNGITGNPHGKEFKVWAAKCSRAFGDRGIEVTTKHSYEIDFRYVWECTDCGLEYKRHSKSINPERHRCGSCKAMLKQIKPTPRATAKQSDYQKFVKEQMKIVKEEYPKSAQKDVMKIIADRWGKRAGSNRATPESDGTPVPESIDKVGSRLNAITL